MSYHHIRAPRPAAAPPAARQLGPVTMALRAMQAELTKPRPIGPVTDAIRTMRATDPAFDQNAELRSLRRALADQIEAHLAVLDALGGDADLEPSLGAPEPFTAGPAMDWAYGSGDDREHENEHGTDEDRGEPSLCGIEVGPGNDWDREGGDVQDEPHDPEEDMGADEDGDYARIVQFSGYGYHPLRAL